MKFGGWKKQDLELHDVSSLVTDQKWTFEGRTGERSIAIALILVPKCRAHFLLYARGLVHEQERLMMTIKKRNRRWRKARTAERSAAIVLIMMET